MENKQIEFLIRTWYEGYTSLKTSTTKKNGFDTNEEQIEIGNFILKLAFLGGYDLKIKDKNLDLLGKPYSENKKAFKYLQTLFNQGTYEVHSKDLFQFKINTKLGKIEFSNLKLTQVGLTQKYRISLIDSERNSDGKWLDESVDYKKVIEVISNFSISKTEFNKLNETKINTLLEKHFRNYFENTSKSTGNLRGLLDLVVGNLDFVIELKLSKSLKNAGQRQRASGQIKQYLEEQGNNNFMLLVVGDKEDKQDKNLKSLEKEVTKEYKCFYHFIELN